ncbi:TRAF3-interacting protein 1-like isoform X2 [Acipenser oxyrinchus oxyrinchus]|uniref:TRAF3-interacting protein 1 n=1 Tax=Acipenser oxyrinchus oxyrinchus TaxID=40147 RepID=A0AAD8DAE5_ACIOX|nr:TRAF3-interacting protein 1-like isoform X2 [Acipenser oxyrinchus oxyrinchus]
MNELMAKKTQETLGKVIKKPPLTEKLLSKPPFRFLHDIFTEVIRTTGFMKGLYSELEMKSENVKDKEAKIAFLQKAIDVVIMVTNESLLVKPGRIVSGHEPEKTNELLQAMGKCCLNKLSSEDAVQRVLAGEKLDLKGKHPSTSKSQDKENRVSKEEDKKRHKDKEEIRDTEIKERSTSRDRKVEQPKETEAKKKDRHKDDERQEKGGDRERTKERDREKEKSRDRDKEKGREKEKDRDKGKERERDREKRRERPKEPEEKAKEPEEKAERKHESPARIPRPSSAKGQRRRPKPGGQDESDSDGEAEILSSDKSMPLENGEAVDAMPTRRRIPRPSSARPAPPRVKRQDSADVPSVERIGSGKPLTAVIVDGKKDSDDEDNDELFVVEEAAPLLPDLPKMEMEPAVELKEDDKHGGLVKKILETKKDYEALQPSSKSKDQDKTIVSEATKRKERDLVSREIEKLRSSIQTVCRSALPLGKIMDYIQEDMDSMKKELQMWRSENAEHAAALLKEQRITDNAVEPLKAGLVELEQLIKDQQDKICAAKANILKNEEKIEKMVSSINFSSRT